MKHSVLSVAVAAALVAPLSAFSAGAPMGGGMGHAMGSPTMAGRGFSSPMMTSGIRATSPRTAATTSLSAPTNTGQPNQSCQAGANYPANTPGNSFNAPGSAFNPSGVADAKYAGTQPQNSGNPHSVSQYDVACTH